MKSQELNSIREPDKDELEELNELDKERKSQFNHLFKTVIGHAELQRELKKNGENPMLVFDIEKALADWHTGSERLPDGYQVLVLDSLFVPHMRHVQTVVEILTNYGMVYLSERKTPT